ncbi:MAG: Hpt domain-containing protein [Bdellovibrionales bacterium]|nr:Hpt domain-containing protein [Bdellovibrionales bacterium]
MMNETWNGNKIFEESVLLAWKEVDPVGWSRVAQEIGQLFLERAPEQYEILLSCAARGDREGMRQAAHSLKSSCGNVGALRASGLLQALEVDSGGVDSQEVASRLKQLESLFKQSQDLLRQFLKSNSSS